MTDWRALCAELLDELQYQTDWSAAEPQGRLERLAKAKPKRSR